MLYPIFFPTHILSHLVFKIDKSCSNTSRIDIKERLYSETETERRKIETTASLQRQKGEINLDYVDETRGKILNRKRKNQIIDFSGLRYGRGTPTDIDGLLEKDRKAFIFYEYKLGNAEMPEGQRETFMRLVDALASADKKAILVVCSHDTENPEQDIDGANSRVSSYYFNRKWYKSTETVKQLTDNFLNFARG